jgi:hypothetical protein
MSVIDTAGHSVVTYDPKSSKAFTGQRLSKVTYKTVSDKTSEFFGIKRESKCVSIPLIAHVDVISNAQALAPYVAEYLQSVQDKIVRERIDAGCKTITQEEISITAIMEWLDTNNESGRLTKDTVAAWFDENIADSLALVLADKLGVSETPTNAENAQVMKVLGTFKDKVSSLAGGKTMYEPKLCESLKKCIELAPAGDALASKFTARLDKMILASKVDVDMLDLL